MKTLKNVWEAWKKIARKIGTFQAKVLLTVFYLVILAPFGILFRFFKDALHLRKPVSDLSHWKVREDAHESIERAGKPY